MCSAPEQKRSIGKTATSAFRRERIRLTRTGRREAHSDRIHEEYDDPIRSISLKYCYIMLIDRCSSRIDTGRIVIIFI